MYTYIISTECKTYLKIGKSINIDKRLSGLQTGSPTELVLEGWFEGDIEDQLHKEYSKFNKRNEWFLYQILEKIIKKEGYIPYTKPRRTKVKGRWYNLKGPLRIDTPENTTNCEILYKDIIGYEVRITAGILKKADVGDSVKITDMETTVDEFFGYEIGCSKQMKEGEYSMTVIKILPRDMQMQMSLCGYEW